MIRSMTGWGRGRAAEGDIAVVVEVRSVNTRGREIRFRLPSELFAAEDVFRQRVQERVARGRIDVSVGWEGAAPGLARFAVNKAGAAALVAAWRELQAAHSLPDPPTAAGLLRLPGVIENAPASELDLERLLRVATTALDEALAEHRAAREREGQNLARDLEARCSTVRALVAEVEQRLRDAPARLAAELRARVKSLLAEIPVDETRVAQEIALLAQRADVTEEQVRLAAHLERLAALFAPGAEEVGRTIEFVVQEIRREVSTLAAKAGDPEVDARVLALRVELERLREQAANLE